MLRVFAGLLASLFICMAIAVPALGIWGIYEASKLANPIGYEHWLLARLTYVIFLLAFGFFCALVAFVLLRYMYSGREKAKLPPSHRMSLPPD